jgi:2-polyprenyl-3-methyl-5-hydroxy-6-metoxy-1,4-benzoquinol methylase
MTQAIAELDALKNRLRATWMSGDFDRIAQTIEAGAVEFIEGLALQPGTTVLDVACGSDNLAMPAARRRSRDGPEAGGWRIQDFPAGDDRFGG